MTTTIDKVPAFYNRIASEETVKGTYGGNWRTEMSVPRVLVVYVEAFRLTQVYEGILDSTSTGETKTHESVSVRRSPVEMAYEDIYLSEEEADNLDDIIKKGLARPTVEIPQRQTVHA